MTIRRDPSDLTAAAGARVIEAKGMLVLPGGVDPHVHLTPTRTATTLKGADDYTSGSLRSNCRGWCPRDRGEGHAGASRRRRPARPPDTDANRYHVEGCR